MCVDYRDLNKALRPVDSPLPRSDWALTAMSEGMYGEPEPLNESSEDRQIRANGGHGPKFFCSVDLAQGFHNIPVAKSSQHLTCFVTPSGKWAYARCPFGLAAAPSHCQNLLGEVMSGLEQISCSYMDDTIVWANSFAEMLERIDLVLERFENAGLSLKTTKCSFFAIKCAFLGHVVSRYGVSVCPSKVDAIKRISSTLINNITAVRAFLGSCSYYRKHIRSFAEIARPLIDLTKKDVDVATASQEPLAQAAIETLKTALTTAPVLAMPIWNRQWIVHSDASTSGLGAVLCQQDDNGLEHPVAYWGRVLTPCESRYTVSELELLAVICCIKQWRHYLWSYTVKPFLLFVDHGALLYLHSARDSEGGGPASRLQRWYLKLQEYNFEVRHRPGRIHHDADFLSRMQGNPQYSKLLKTPEHVSWATVQDPSEPKTELAVRDATTSEGEENKKYTISTSSTVNAQDQPINTADATKVGGVSEGNTVAEQPAKPYNSPIQDSTSDPPTLLKNRETRVVGHNVIFETSSILDTPAAIIGHFQPQDAEIARGLSRAILDKYPQANQRPTTPSTFSLIKETGMCHAVLNMYTSSGKNDGNPASVTVTILDHFLKNHPSTKSLALPLSHKEGHSGKEKDFETSLIEWAAKYPDLTLYLHKRLPRQADSNAPLVGTPAPSLTKPSRKPSVHPIVDDSARIDGASINKEWTGRDIVAAVRTTLQPASPPISTSTSSGDLSTEETVELMKALTINTSLDDPTPEVEMLEEQIRNGRSVSSLTLEATITQLRNQGLPRRAAEVLELALQFDLATKKGHYEALKATHLAGLHLLAAPILRRLNVGHGVVTNNTRRALIELDAEYEETPTERPPISYHPFIKVAKIAFISEDGNWIWAHSRTNPSEPGSLDLPGGKTEPKDGDVRATLRREIQEELGTLPPRIQAELEEEMRNFPEGHSRCRVYPTGFWKKMHLIHIWAVTMPLDDWFEFRHLEPDLHFKAAWRPTSELLADFHELSLKQPYARGIAKAIRRRSGLRLPMTTPHMPWPTSSANSAMAKEAAALEQTPSASRLRRALNLRVAACRSLDELKGVQEGRRLVAAYCFETSSTRHLAAANRTDLAMPDEETSSSPGVVERSAKSVFDIWKQYSTGSLPHTQELRIEQRNDLWCREIADHLLTEYIPPRLSGQTVSRFCAMAALFTIRDGLLFRYHSDPRLRRELFQLAIPVSIREAFLEAFHDRLGHPGIERTFQALRLRAYWPGMRDAVQSHVLACHECLVAKKPNKGFGSTVLPRVPSRPFDMVYADVLTLPKSHPIGPHGLTFSKLLIFCDGLTRWVEAVPLPGEPDAEEVVDAFVQNVVCRHGVPRVLVCDRGANLIASLCKSVYDILGVDLRPSTSYHHMTAGIVERFNRHLNELLRATAQDGRDWPLHVPWLCFYFRAIPHSVSKVSPAYLNLGRELRCPPDSVLFQGTSEGGLQPPSDGLTHSARQLEYRLRIAWEEAGRLSEKSQLDGKERRDLTRSEPVYSPQQWVLLRRSPNDKTGVPQGGKLANIYEGPYRIAAILDNGNVRLRDLPRKIHDEFHVSRLRPYVAHDEIPVCEDEYKVKSIIGRRGSAAQREYLVWWVGWPKKEASWEPQANLLSRCLELTAEYDAEIEASKEPDRPSSPESVMPLTPTDPPETVPSPPWKNGDHAMAPSSLWPNESCDEFQGSGWLVKIVKIHEDKKTVSVQFLKARSENGRPFAKVNLAISALAQIPGSKSSDVNELNSNISQLLHDATQPAPATRAELINGVWHYERREPTGQGKTINRMVDQRYFSPEQLESLEGLRQTALNKTAKDLSQLTSAGLCRDIVTQNDPTPLPPTQTRPGRDRPHLKFTQKPSAKELLTGLRRITRHSRYSGTEPEDNSDQTRSPTSTPKGLTEKLPLKPIVAHARGIGCLNPTLRQHDPWGPFSMPHQPDDVLSEQIKRNAGLGKISSSALVSTLQRNHHPGATQLEDTKQKMYAPSPSQDDYRSWIRAMESHYKEPDKPNPGRTLCQPVLTVVANSIATQYKHTLARKRNQRLRNNLDRSSNSNPHLDRTDEAMTSLALRAVASRYGSSQR